MCTSTFLLSPFEVPLLSALHAEQIDGEFSLISLGSEATCRVALFKFEIWASLFSTADLSLAIWESFHKRSDEGIRNNHLKR
jgi:hypothetical protein